MLVLALLEDSYFGNGTQGTPVNRRHVSDRIKHFFQETCVLNMIQTMLQSHIDCGQVHTVIRAPVTQVADPAISTLFQGSVPGT